MRCDMKTIQQRLNEKSHLIPFSGCNIWVGGHTPKGYGVIHYKGRQQYTHRVQYQIAYGEIPKGMFVLHRCDVTSCMNPEHLFLGTAKDNTQDMMNKNRHKVPCGEFAAQAKLTSDQVKHIRSTYIPYDRQFGGGALAKKYGMSNSQITQIVKGRYYK